MADYHVVWIYPAGYLHAEGLRELVEGLVFALRGLGYDTTLGRNSLAQPARHIFVGGHLLTGSLIDAVPPGSIVFNTEQIDPASMVHGDYLKLLQRVEVWDYSQRNIERLRQAGITQTIRHVPVGYVAELTRIAPAPLEDIDVLFYGSLNERRRYVLEQLQRAGVKVVHLFGVYGRERDEAIARSRLVLNMHFYPAAIFESVRVSFLMANRKVVVAECGLQTEMDEGLRGGVVLADYDQLVATCLALLNDESRRQQVQQAAFATICRRPQTEVLRGVLQERYLPLPGVINLGSGKDWRQDCLNIDVNPAWKPDLVLDLNQPVPLGVSLDSRRFGTITLRENQFDGVVAMDILEHIVNLSQLMTSLLKLLKIGGTLTIKVPYDLSLGAWQDPTHVRAFNENSWIYYGDWHWYLGWLESRFDVVEFTMLLTDYGMGLANKGMSRENLARMPRAVDAMRVVLKKRLLTPQEKLALGQTLPRL